MAGVVRVAVADDSVVARRLITTALERDPGIKVVGTANDGNDAIALIGRVSPDVLTLDLEMPGLDGLGTLDVLRKRFPRLPVIVVSSLTARGAAATLEALSRGASDYVTKPTSDLRCAPLDWLAGELHPKVKALAAPVRRLDGPVVLRSAPVSTAPPRLLVVGASTGGPDAVATVLGALPQPIPVPVLVVQHMPPFFTAVFAERLARACRCDAAEVTDGAPLRPGTIRIAPGDHHVVVRDTGTSFTGHLNRDAPVNFCRPSVDVSLRSASQAAGGRVLAVILTGIGHDGRDGAAALTRSGGVVLAQDQATSVVWGMPGAVAQAGLAHKVLPLAELGPEIARRICLRPTGTRPMSWTEGGTAR